MATSSAAPVSEGIDPVAAGLRDAVGAQARTGLEVARDRYALAYQWCLAHAPVDETSAATTGDVRLPGTISDCDSRVGGQGTPGVAPFAVEEYAATAGLSIGAAVRVLSDAMDLNRRLAKLWDKVVALEVPAWTAARIAEDSSHLSLNAANWIDDELHRVGRYGRKRIQFVLKQAIATFHPEMLRTPELDRDDWDVTLDHATGADGTSRLDAIGDSLDLERFHDLVRDEAHLLGQLGDPDTLGQRKAKALGVIADRRASRDQTLDLGSHGHATDRAHESAGHPAGGQSSAPSPEDLAPDYATDSLLVAMAAAEQEAERAEELEAIAAADAAECGDDYANPADVDLARIDDAPVGHGFRPNRIDQDTARILANTLQADDASLAARSASVAAGFGDPAHPGTGESVTRPRSRTQPRIHIHLSADDLDSDPDTTLVDAGRLGTQTMTRLRTWLATCGSDARVVPVIDLNREWSVDQHDPPDPMREQVILRDEHCMFPHCIVDARRCDLDHIEPYDPDGPPGQTRPTNLAPLCRAHHRMKTFRGWSYRRERDGSYLWTSPYGARWRVTPAGRTEQLRD